MKKSKSLKQQNRYEAFVSDGRNLLRRAWVLERSLLLARQLEEDLASKKDLKNDRELLSLLRDEVLKSVYIQTRTMMDSSRDAIGILGLIDEIISEIGLLTQERWIAAHGLWKLQGDRSGVSFITIWQGARSIPERKVILNIMKDKVVKAKDDVDTWISQRIAHEIREHRREKRIIMTGNLTYAATVCIKITRQTIQLLADVDPMDYQLPAHWSFLEKD